MPLYDYKCPACGAEKEVQHSMSEIGKIEVACANCGKQMKKMLSAPTLIGFDDVGRSISKNDKASSEKTENAGNSSSTTKTSKKDAA
jgi:putative FmdB family regulatory protein